MSARNVQDAKSFRNQILAGQAFTLSVKDDALANDGVLLMLLRTAEGRGAMLRVRARISPPSLAVAGSASSLGSLRLAEAPTSSADGSEVTPRNLDRGSAVAATMDTFTGPTVSADGTVLIDQTVVGELDAGEILLAGGTDYLLRLTNLSDLAAGCSLHLEFWETGA